MSEKQVINDKLQGSTTTYWRFGGVVNNQIKKVLLLNLSVIFKHLLRFDIYGHESVAPLFWPILYANYISCEKSENASKEMPYGRETPTTTTLMVWKYVLTKKTKSDQLKHFSRNVNKHFPISVVFTARRLFITQCMPGPMSVCEGRLSK